MLFRFEKFLDFSLGEVFFDIFKKKNIQRQKMAKLSRTFLGSLGLQI